MRSSSRALPSGGIARGGSAKPGRSIRDTSPRSSVRLRCAVSTPSQVRASSSVHGPTTCPSRRNVVPFGEDSIEVIRSMAGWGKWVSVFRHVPFAIDMPRCLSMAWRSAFRSERFLRITSLSRSVMATTRFVATTFHDRPRNVVGRKDRGSTSAAHQTLCRVMPSFRMRLRSVLGLRLRVFAAPPFPSIRQSAFLSTAMMC